MPGDTLCGSVRTVREIRIAAHLAVARHLRGLSMSHTGARAAQLAARSIRHFQRAEVLRHQNAQARPAPHGGRHAADR